MSTNPTPDPSEGQERSDESKLTSFVTKMVGHQRTIAAGLVEVAKGMEAIAAGYEALQLDVEKIHEAAYRAGREDEAAALARGQQPREEPWQIRAAATGGGPCPTCRKPFWTHVCLSCSPDYQTPGKGCINCRNSGMDQTPCKPAVDSIVRGVGDVEHVQDGAR